jgi:very-short-patch-repair endonuclease
MYSKRHIILLARELRKRSTKAERLLWDELRNRRFHGIKFLRQYPIVYEVDRGLYRFYIPDFYSHKLKLAIELDGKIHQLQKEYDEDRDFILNQFGIAVIRFENESTGEMEKLKTDLLEFINQLRSSPSFRTK